MSLLYLILLSVLLFNHAALIRDTGFQAKNGVSLHNFNWFPIIRVATHPFPSFSMCRVRVNSLSLRTISTYLLKLFRCQSFVLSIIVQNIQLPKYTWFNSTNRWNQFFNWMLYLFTLLYRGMMHQIPSQWAHECALYHIGRHITCLSVDNKERLSVPIFILQH